MHGHTHDSQPHPGLALGDRVAWAVARAREAGLRRTRALEELLRELIDAGRPLTLAQLAESDRLRDLCDKATVYRLLGRLAGKGVVRRLGLHERSAYFTALIPGEHRDYLICTECGAIDTIDMKCPVEKLEKEVQAKSGFTGLYHELEFFGVCPLCG
jgi:Fur family ferric uptake transcriptional regulator